MGVLDSFSLKGKVALLTGGAGLYGRQLTEALVEAGAETYIASRGIEKLSEFAGKIGAKAIQMDLADKESISNCVKEIVAKSGRIDILVNNAVTRCACGADPVAQLELFDESLHVNASAMFYLTQLVAQDMIPRKNGSVINIGSYMGLLGPNPTNYVGTDMWPAPGDPLHGLSPIYFYEKGGMANYTRWAASRFGEWNIRVNCIHPGGFFDNQPERFVEQYSANTMLGRMANGTDLKGILVFLASDASAYITGTNIPVDGGYTAK